MSSVASSAALRELEEEDSGSGSSKESFSEGEEGELLESEFKQSKFLFPAAETEELLGAIRETLGIREEPSELSLYDIYIRVVPACKII